MTKRQFGEASSGLMAVTAWGQSIRFGNLVRANGEKPVGWFTVELSKSEVFAFDAESLKRANRSMIPTFSGVALDNDVRLAAILADKTFSTFAGFGRWVRKYYYVVLAQGPAPSPPPPEEHPEGEDNDAAGPG